MNPAKTTMKPFSGEISLAGRVCVVVLLAFILFPPGRAWAQQATNIANYSVNSAVPDNDASGLSSTVTFASSQISSLDAVVVTLDLSGGYNGDLYAYLTHSSGFAVLLNRAGRTAANGLGYADSGFNVTLGDSAANGDIHSYRFAFNPGGGAVSGVWAPDARNIDPTVALDTSPRSAFLNSFRGLDPNGTWTLFVADVSAGGVSTLNSWGLQVVGVPEPGTSGLIILGGVVLLSFSRHSKQQKCGKRRYAWREFR